MPTERQTLKIEEAAKVLGISRNTAYDAVKSGQLPTVKIGRRFLVPKAALERMLESAVVTGP
jgi:excisionase family DNA binding protein